MGRISGKPNKLTAKVKERLATIIDEAMDSIDIEKLTIAERLKLIQIGLQRCILDERQLRFQLKQNLIHQHMPDGVLDDVFS